MKQLFFSFVILSLLCNVAIAQVRASTDNPAPQGAVIYALPSTVIEIQATAVHELFTAGPYARYAQKYLGMEAKTSDAESYQLEGIALRTLTEADITQMYALVIKDKNVSANFLAFSAEGLIVSPDQTGKDAMRFQFATTAPGAFHDTGIEPAIGKDKITLYRTEKTASGFAKVPVQQNQLVEKSIERRAEEAANFIFNLRKKRVELITGEIELAMSNDGLRAALEEISRLEEEYLSLFMGKTTTGSQSAVFYLTPGASQAKQLYIAFRFSDTQGLLSADNVAGRPVTLELNLEKNNSGSPSNAWDSGDKKSPRIVYRIPATVQAQVNDGQANLLQTRLLVHQFGQTMTFPASLQVK